MNVPTNEPAEQIAARPPIPPPSKKLMTCGALLAFLALFAGEIQADEEVEPKTPEDGQSPKPRRGELERLKEAESVPMKVDDVKYDIAYRFFSYTFRSGFEATSWVFTVWLDTTPNFFEPPHRGGVWKLKVEVGGVKPVVKNYQGKISGEEAGDLMSVLHRSEIFELPEEQRAAGDGHSYTSSIRSIYHQIAERTSKSVVKRISRRPGSNYAIGRVFKHVAAYADKIFQSDKQNKKSAGPSATALDPKPDDKKPATPKPKPRPSLGMLA